MGQLIKLQNYISRYEQNIFHYPARFVTLKKQQWEKWQREWNEGKEPISFTMPPQEQTEVKKQPLIGKIKTWFQRKRREEAQPAEVEPVMEASVPHEEEMEDDLDYPPCFQRPESVTELKQHFLNHLFHFQIKWATSTLTESSRFNKKFLFDERMKYFLQRFPDTYLVMYKPIFLLKKAPVEVECVLIGPDAIWCIVFVEDRENSVFIGSKDKFWEVRNKEKVKKVLNPLISLERTEKIVRKILQWKGIEYPVHKVLLSRNGYIDYPALPFGVQLVDKSRHEEWFQAMRSLRIPLKSTQLKAAQVLLEYCETDSAKRKEWMQNEDG